MQDIKIQNNNEYNTPDNENKILEKKLEALKKNK